VDANEGHSGLMQMEAIPGRLQCCHFNAYSFEGHRGACVGSN